MVILHVKRSDNNQFLFETTAGIPVKDLLDLLVKGKCLSILVDWLTRSCF